jgi:hypothetical protein
MAFGLELTGLISNARRAFRSRALARSTTLASLLRNRLCVSALKSGGSGSLPLRAAASIAARLPASLHPGRNRYCPVWRHYDHNAAPDRT